jgi:hypothetical protein
MCVRRCMCMCMCMHAHPFHELVCMHRCTCIPWTRACMHVCTCIPWARMHAQVHVHSMDSCMHACVRMHSMGSCMHVWMHVRIHACGHGVAQRERLIRSELLRQSFHGGDDLLEQCRQHRNEHSSGIETLSEPSASDPQEAVR